jgi:hypothetical protein
VTLCGVSLLTWIPTVLTPLLSVCGHRQSAEELNTLLRNFDQMSALRTWLVKRVERGLPLPESMEETTELVRLDPTGFPAKKFRYVQPPVSAVAAVYAPI